jgi:hypothetical protein
MWSMVYEASIGDLERGSVCLNTKLIGRLQSLQGECLRQISGCFGKTACQFLEKELFIQDIKMFFTVRPVSSGPRASAPAIHDGDKASARNTEHRRSAYTLSMS